MYILKNSFEEMSGVSMEIKKFELLLLSKQLKYKNEIGRKKNIGVLINKVQNFQRNF